MNQTQTFLNGCGNVQQPAAKFFEAAAETFEAKPMRHEEAEKARRRFFADASGRKNALVSTSEEELRPAPLFPAARNRPPEFSHALLFYLDQIVYLEEISENLEKLDAAIESGNAAKVSLIAGDCAGISASCGMFAALKPLRELERVEHKNQLPQAVNLSKAVCEEFERFKFTLKENLEQIK